jgi:hypothetical protein
MKPIETKFFVWGGGQRAISFLLKKIAMQSRALRAFSKRGQLNLL